MEPVETFLLTEVLSLFVHEVGGGLLLGALLGWITFKLMKSIDDYNIEVIITLATVMTGTVIAQYLHVSAPLAMVVAGLIVGGNKQGDTRCLRSLKIMWINFGS